MKKKLPKIKTDGFAEKLLSRDLSSFLHSGNFHKATFEFAPKDKSITLRVSSELLGAVQNVAKKRKISYQKLIREALELYLKKAA